MNAKFLLIAVFAASLTGCASKINTTPASQLYQGSLKLDNVKRQTSARIELRISEKQADQTFETTHGLLQLKRVFYPYLQLFEVAKHRLQSPSDFVAEPSITSYKTDSNNLFGYTGSNADAKVVLTVREKASNRAVFAKEYAGHGENNQFESVRIGFNPVFASIALQTEMQGIASIDAFEEVFNAFINDWNEWQAKHAETVTPAPEATPAPASAPVAEQPQATVQAQ